jgi:hypothetical protein
LQRARRDEHRSRVREPAHERGDREDPDASEEEAAPAEQVGHPPAEEQEAPEGERIAVDDPLQALGAEPERALDRRQRDVHDRRVEHDHELGKTDDDEDPPAAGRPGARFLNGSRRRDRDGVLTHASS